MNQWVMKMKHDIDLLLENLFEGDLDGVIRPVLSIDDFESKIDENALVLAFYSKNFEAAEDLAVFIERSHIDHILDTEVSINTNKENDHLVFIEIDISNLDHTEIGKLISEILKIAARLVGRDTKWKMKNNRILGKKLYNFTDDGLNTLLKKIYKKG
jgi:hypothetical protein